MQIKYLFSVGNLKRVKRQVCLSLNSGLSREESVLRGIKLADKIISMELDKHKKTILNIIEYILVKTYIVEKARIEDPMEEFNGPPDNVVNPTTNSIDALINNYN